MKVTVTGLPQVFVAALDRRLQKDVARCRTRYSCDRIRTCPDFAQLWAEPPVEVQLAVTRLLWHLHPLVWDSLALPFMWMMTLAVTRLLRHLHPLV